MNSHQNIQLRTDIEVYLQQRQAELTRTKAVIQTIRVYSKAFGSASEKALPARIQQVVADWDSEWGWQGSQLATLNAKYPKEAVSHAIVEALARSAQQIIGKN